MYFEKLAQWARATCVLLLCTGLLGISPIQASEDGRAFDDKAAGDKAAGEALGRLRDLDRSLERLARQKAHPQGVPVSVEGLQRLDESLRRLEPTLEVLAETHPEGIAKQRALLARVRQLVEASPQPGKGGEAPFAVHARSRPLDVAEAARVGSALFAAASPAQDVPPAACGAAPSLGVERRVLTGVDDSRAALVRFLAPTDGRFLVDTTGSRTDTRLLVVRACGDSDARVLAQGDDEFGLRAQTQFSARQGDELWILVGADRAGWVQLAVEQLVEGLGTSSIAGTVTARDSGLPIDGLSVVARLDTGGSVSTHTDSGGHFQFSFLEAGTYEVFTRDFDRAWVHQIWDGIECGVGPNACYVYEGDPIPLAAGQAVKGIDVSLRAPATLSGRVADSSTGAPVEYVRIRLERANGNQRYATSDAAGRYRFTGVGPGIFYLKASSDFFDNELFDDIPCDASCTITDGTPVEVEPEDAIVGLDFDLDRIAGLFGVVVDAATGDPAWASDVHVYDADGEFVGGDYSSWDGRFFVEIALPGVYFARTQTPSYLRWVDQMWQGVDCDGTCDLDLATPIVLGQNQAVEIGFSLVEKGDIAGTVVAADGGQIGQSSMSVVEVFDEWGLFVESQLAETDGSYRIPHLDAGSYFVVASNPEFRSEVYDDIPCSVGNQCDPHLGLPVAVQNSVTTGGIDFALERLGIIEGTVRRIGGGARLPAVVVRSEAAGGGQSEPLSDRTAEDGEYRLAGLEAGSYYVYTRSSPYLDKAFDDLPCEGSCDLTQADPVVVPSLGAVVQGVDFALQRRGWIEGTVSHHGTGDPLEARVFLLEDDGSVDGSTATASDGSYLFEGLQDGSYYLITDEESDDYVDELYADQPCEAGFGGAECDLAAGTPIEVAAENGAEIDFSLDLGGVIEGTVEDQFGNPLGGAVAALDGSGKLFRTASPFNGQYEIAGLPAGSYFLLTYGTSHADELWPDVPCLGWPVLACDLADGVELSLDVGETASDIDFALDELASIEGEFVDADTGETISQSDVELYDASGALYQREYSANPFRLTGIIPGTYFLRSLSAAGYVDGVYGGELCTPTCDVTTGIPIEVDIGDVVADLEIPLPMGPGIEGRVIDGPTGVPLAGVSIDLWDADGDHVGTAATDGDGWYRLPGAYGTYFISTYNDLGLEDFLYDGIPCPDGSAWEGLCDPTEGTPYVIEEYQPLQRLDLPFGDPAVFTDGFESGDTAAWSQSVGD